MTKSTVYKEFLTNTAVAWFTAGIITPIFIENISKKRHFQQRLARVLEKPRRKIRKKKKNKK